MGSEHAENDIESSEQFINKELSILKYDHTDDDLSNPTCYHNYAVWPEVVFEVQERESYDVCICKIVSFNAAVISRQIIL